MPVYYPAVTAAVVISRWDFSRSFDRKTVNVRGANLRQVSGVGQREL
jgi:hypothetical protein